MKKRTQVAYCPTKTSRVLISAANIAVTKGQIVELPCSHDYKYRGEIAINEKEISLDSINRRNATKKYDVGSITTASGIKLEKEALQAILVKMEAISSQVNYIVEGIKNESSPSAIDALLDGTGYERINPSEGISTFGYMYTIDNTSFGDKSYYENMQSEMTNEQISLNEIEKIIEEGTQFRIDEIAKYEYVFEKISNKYYKLTFSIADSSVDIRILYYEIDNTIYINLVEFCGGDDNGYYEWILDAYTYIEAVKNIIETEPVDVAKKYATIEKNSINSNGGVLKLFCLEVDANNTKYSYDHAKDIYKIFKTDKSTGTEQLVYTHIGDIFFLYGSDVKRIYLNWSEDNISLEPGKYRLEYGEKDEELFYYEGTFEIR